jgi:predicted hydrocarbon binding protein
MDGLGLSKNYKRINLIRPATYSRLSLKNLLSSKFFTHKEGFIERNSFRYALCESSLVYLLEEELVKIGAERDLFEICSSFGATIAKTENPKSTSGFLTDYMSSLGWGDVHMDSSKKTKVFSNYFPWSKFSKKSQFIIYRGFLSGVVSEFLGKEILFEKFDHKLSGDGFSLVVSEK